MKTIALDTSFGTTVAVLDGTNILAQLDFAESMTHAERIGSALSAVLKKAGVSVFDIERVVVGVGPGPFTGLRVGIAAAKFFAMGTDAELVAVCSLDAIAWQFYQNGGSGKLLVTTDARRKEWFWAKYDGLVDGIPNRLEGPKVSRPEDIDTAGFASCDLVVSAGALGQIAALQGSAGSRDVTPIYLREPDATPGKPKKVSG